MDNTKLITIPSPDYELNELVNYQGMGQLIKSRLYDLDKGEWLYRFDNRATYITKDEITSNRIAWQDRI